MADTFKDFFFSKLAGACNTRRSELMQITNDGRNRCLCDAMNFINLFASEDGEVRWWKIELFLRMWPIRNGKKENEFFFSGETKKKMWRGGREIGGKLANLFTSKRFKVVGGEAESLASVLIPGGVGSVPYFTGKMWFYFKRQEMFWSFRAQFWLRAIARFLNETLVEFLIFRESSSGAFRLHNRNGNVLKPTQDESRIFGEPLKFDVLGFFGFSALCLWGVCLSYYRIITAAL
jgi:hypothetical protein